MKRIKNITYHIIALLVIMVAFSSCEDFLEQKSSSRITPDKHYQSEDDLWTSMDGLLAQLQNSIPNLIIVDGLLSDAMDVTENYDGNLVDINNHNLSVGNPYLDNSGFYKIIINANELLLNLSKIHDVEPDFDSLQSASFTRYIIATRSWSYFTLAKLNGEVAWLGDNVSEIPEGGLVYLSKESLLDSLVSQIKPTLHVDEDIKEIDISGYINPKAILGEIYLEQNQYDSAAVYLKLAMESYENDVSIYKLNDEYDKDDWSNIFINSDKIAGNFVEGNWSAVKGAENICVCSFKMTEGQNNPVTGWTLPYGEFLVKPSVAMVNKFNTIVANAKKDYRGIGVSIDTLVEGKYFINKYNIEESEPYSSDIIVSRAADIHLLLAEALNRMGDYTTAMILMNGGFSQTTPPTAYRRWNTGLGVRGRVVLEPHIIPETMTDPNMVMLYVEDLILEERAVELAFEGKRWFDLVRIAKRRNYPEYLANRVADKFTDKAQSDAIKEKLKNMDTWYIPLGK